MKTCIICGQVLPKKPRGPQKTTCSDKCRKALSRKKQSNVTSFKPVTVSRETYEILGFYEELDDYKLRFPERFGDRYIFYCPNCGSSLLAPDNMGQSIQCSVCKNGWVNIATLAVSVCKMSQEKEHPVLKYYSENRTLPLSIHFFTGYQGLIQELQAIR